MATVSTSVYLAEGDATTAHVRTTARGRYLSLQLAGDVSIVLAGLDAVTAAQARAIAAALLAAADQLDAPALDPSPDAVTEVPDAGTL